MLATFMRAEPARGTRIANAGDSVPALARYFAGTWHCRGGTPAGRTLESDVVFTIMLGARWLSTEHTDVPPGRYHAFSLWRGRHRATRGAEHDLRQLRRRATFLRRVGHRFYRLDARHDGSRLAPREFHVSPRIRLRVLVRVACSPSGRAADGAWGFRNLSAVAEVILGKGEDGSGKRVGRGSRFPLPSFFRRPRPPLRMPSRELRLISLGNRRQ